MKLDNHHKKMKLVDKFLENNREYILSDITTLFDTVEYEYGKRGSYNLIYVSDKRKLCRDGMDWGSICDLENVDIDRLKEITNFYMFNLFFNYIANMGHKECHTLSDFPQKKIDTPHLDVMTSFNKRNRGDSILDDINSLKLILREILQEQKLNGILQIKRSRIYTDDGSNFEGISFEMFIEEN